MNIDMEIREAMGGLLPLSLYNQYQLGMFRHKIAAADKSHPSDEPMEKILVRAGYIAPTQWQRCECYRVGGGIQLIANPITYDAGNAAADRDCPKCGGAGRTHELIPDGRCTCIGPFHQPE